MKIFTKSRVANFTAGVVILYTVYAVVFQEIRDGHDDLGGQGKISPHLVENFAEPGNEENHQESDGQEPDRHEQGGIGERGADPAFQFLVLVDETVAADVQLGGALLVGVYVRVGVAGRVLGRVAVANGVGE